MPGPASLQTLAKNTEAICAELETRRERYYQIFLMIAPMSFALICAIAAALDELGAGPGDLALAQAANGGDLLFLEACKARGLRLVLMLPFAEAYFIARSVCRRAGGARWRARPRSALVAAHGRVPRSRFYSKYR